MKHLPLLLALCGATTALPQEISITFTDPLKEQGVSLVRRATCGPAGEVAGKAAWVSGHGAVPGDQWLRAFNLRVDDAAFRADGRAAVEITAVFRQPANSAVEIWANTAAGFQRIEWEWGWSGNWKTLTARVAAPRFNRGGEEPDILVKAWDGDFALHSVSVRDIDFANPAHRVKAVSITRVTSADNFITAPGNGVRVEAVVKNAAPEAQACALRWEVRDFDDAVLLAGEEQATLAAGAETTVPVGLPLEKLAPNPYRARLSAVVLGEVSDAEEALVAVHTEEDAFILFNHEPVLRGMDFVRERNQPAAMNVGGARVRYIEAIAATFGGPGWWNSVLFNFTDPRFQNGNRPVADIRLFHRLPQDAPKFIAIDSQGGSRKVVDSRGRNPAWVVWNARVDDARFNRTPSDINPQEMPANGVDIRYAACTGPAQVRAIWVRGYDLGDAPDFRRLLRFEGLETGRRRFVFEPGQAHVFTLNLSNLARAPLDGVCEVSLADDLGAPLWSRSTAAVVPAMGAAAVPVEFDARALKQGLYRMGFKVLQKGAAEPLAERSYNLLVSEASPLPRADDGEFLYGVDAAYGFLDERFWEWASFMGADILRGWGCDQNDPEQMLRARELHAKHQFRPYFFQDVAWHPDPAERAAENERRARRAAVQAKLHDPQGRAYWELGNEPDLPGFYFGPVEAYAEGFDVIARAIKEATPTAIVMNGGLCFAGGEGKRRAIRLVEVFPMEHLDAWAFHAHGPGAKAERNMYELMRGTARQFGKDIGVYVDTESGFAAASPAQQRVQARTAIQKLAYAQSVGVKVFMWFRLFITGGDANYTCLEGNLEEPRSCILAYRTMVKHLRHLAYRETLDLAPLKG
ncbi:MAG: hypothetical protein FWF96_07880, partial [Kiritimatiellaeota bacterium]|nr:hypothetical protein [Kiritimatiellota bacterium]